MKITEICPSISYEISEALNPTHRSVNDRSPPKSREPEKRKPRDSDPPIRTNVQLADGWVWLTGHWRKRMAERADQLGFQPKEAVDLFKEGLALYKERWEAEPVNTQIILRRRGPAQQTLGMEIIKQEFPDDSIRYLLNTAHPTLRYSITQNIYQV
jgi:hypothetical protein